MILRLLYLKDGENSVLIKFPIKFGIMREYFKKGEK